MANIRLHEGLNKIGCGYGTYPQEKQKRSEALSVDKLLMAEAHEFIHGWFTEMGMTGFDWYGQVREASSSKAVSGTIIQSVVFSDGETTEVGGLEDVLAVEGKGELAEAVA